MGRPENAPYYLSAYSLAVKRGFKGTLDEWLESLIGPKGDDGASAYEVAVAGGFEGTEEVWLASLVGPQGPQGQPGEPGEVLRVAITESPRAADKTYAEIYAAHQAGQAVECVLSTGEVLPLVFADPETAIFQSANGAYYSRIVITAENAVIYSSGHYADSEGSDGGYYAPEVADNGDGTMTVSFTPSDADMPAVEPVTVELPAGVGVSGARINETDDDRIILHIDLTNGGTNTVAWNKDTPVKGVDYWTEEDKAEMVADVLAALPAAEGVGF